MKLVLFFTVLAFCSAPLVMQGEEVRAWTNSAGKTIQAEIVKKDETSVDLKLANGKTATVKIVDLSAADQEYIKGWAPKKEEEAKEAKDGEEAAKPDKFTWLKSDDSAFKFAKEAKLPVVILFTGPSWNEPCKKLDSEILDKQDFKKEMAGVAIGLICIADKDKKFKRPWATKLAEKYQSAGGDFPRMVMVDSEGKMLGFLKGFEKMQPKYYAEKIKDVIKNGNPKK